MTRKIREADTAMRLSDYARCRTGGFRENYSAKQRSPRRRVMATQFRNFATGRQAKTRRAGIDAMPRLPGSPLSSRQAARLVEHFVAGTPARTAAELLGVNRN